MARTDYVWVGGENDSVTSPGDWSEGTNWEGGNFPEWDDWIQNDDIVIGSGKYVKKDGAVSLLGSTLNLSGNLTVTNVSLNSQSTITQNGGVLTSSGNLTIQNGSVTITEGSISVADMISVGYAGGTRGSFIMGAESTKGSLTGPTVTTKNLRLAGQGYPNGNGSSEVTLYNGTLTVTGETCVGNNSISAGESYKNDTYTFTLDGATFISSKTNIGQGRVTGGDSQFYMKSGKWSGETVNICYTYVGVTNSGTLTISGGTTNITNKVTVGSINNSKMSGTLIIEGSAATINMNQIEAIADYSSIKFTKGNFIDESGNVQPMFSTINVGKYTTDTDGDGINDADWSAGTATINGAVSVEVNNSFTGDALYTTESIAQKLISAGTLTISDETLANATVTDGWKVEKINNDLVLKPKSLVSVQIADNLATVEATGTEVWVELTGGAENGTANLAMTYNNELGTAETFVDWFNEFGEGQGFGDDVTVAASKDGLSVVFSGLELDAYGSGNLYLNYSDYNAYHVNAFPEPSTWALLVLGASALFFGRRKR